MDALTDGVIADTEASAVHALVELQELDADTLNAAHTALLLALAR